MLQGNSPDWPFECADKAKNSSQLQGHVIDYNTSIYSTNGSPHMGARGLCEGPAAFISALGLFLNVKNNCNHWHVSHCLIW